MDKSSLHTHGGHDEGARHSHVCPKSRQKRVSGWLFPIVGILSFIWFLIRVIPKPSRAAYPCQRMAAPLAASFVVWILGIVGTALAYRKWKAAIIERRRFIPALCVAAALAAGIVTVTSQLRPVVAQAPAHNAIGVGQGIYPGRVVWVHNPGATDWAGFSSSERWYDDSRTNPVVVERMLSQSVRGLTGKSGDAEAWDAIFRYFNQKQGRGDRGYYPGEKVMIKLNLVTCNTRNNWVDLGTFDKIATAKNRVDVSPQMVKGLLKALVYTVGVNQSDITVGDSTAYWPACYLDQIRALFPNVNYEQNGPGAGRTAAEFSTVPFYWSTSGANGKLQDYLPISCVQAAYFINVAVLKGHSSGVTLCGKNNYGSFIRDPDGYLEGQGMKNYYNWHLSLPNAGWSPGMGHYRAMVDMMGHPELGGKTLLYLIDGLYGGYYADSLPRKWNSAPFNGDWPSSVFASQDPVAIDSVAYDFLKNEWPNVVENGVEWAGSLQGGAEDYLHEAALANNPPSGTFYDPDKDGVRMTSLGVHEHWNDPVNKQYSRNLGLDSGIELVKLTYDNGAIPRAKLESIGTNCFVAAAVVTAVFTDCIYVQGDDRSSGIRVLGSHALTVGKRANVTGVMQTLAATGERCIAMATVTEAGSGTVDPLVLNGRAIGGGPWNYNSVTGAGQRGIPGSSGLNNIGLLVRFAGRFRYIDASTFGVSDGSGREIRCYTTPGMTINSGWTKVRVTGISSCKSISGEVQSVLLLRTQSDIKVL